MYVCFCTGTIPSALSKGPRDAAALLAEPSASNKSLVRVRAPATCSDLGEAFPTYLLRAVPEAAGSMQFDFDSAMGYGPNQKFTSAGDAVVPSLTPRVSGFSQYPFNMQSAGSAFDKAAYDLPLKPLYEIPGEGVAPDYLRGIVHYCVLFTGLMTVSFFCRRWWRFFQLFR